MLTTCNWANHSIGCLTKHSCSDIYHYNMDAEDSLHFTPIYCRMWLTVGNRWYLETFFPTLHAQSEGIAIVSQCFMHVIKLIVIVLLYTIIVSSEGDSRPFIARCMYKPTIAWPGILHAALPPTATAVSTNTHWRTGFS